MIRPLLVLCLLFYAQRPCANSAKITCKTCKEFVVSFNKGLEKTAKSNYAGGDTSWEEEKLGSYSDSEVRLVEVLDTVCSKSDYDCSRLLEVTEEDVERWWFKLRKQDQHRDLEVWLCRSHLDVCCPDNTFGPKCTDCPGGPANICGGRGKCEGAGEKEGSGKCECDRGYTGDMCQSCDSKYYHDDDDESNTTETQTLECKACDAACKSCDGPGPGDCRGCATGYEEKESGVCEDIDECKTDPDSRCREGTFCLNTAGSFRCTDCDRACKKVCNGPGPSKCAECASGYTRDDQGTCTDDDECAKGVASCRDGTYCDNTPGKYICKACHVSCLGGCHGAGEAGCVACKEGYRMDDTDGCKDVNECEGDTPPCDQTTEVCSNMIGSYACKCADELVRGDNGDCITEEERKKQRDTVKEEKKKKRKKKKKKAKKANKQPEGEGENGNGKENGVNQKREKEDLILNSSGPTGDEVLDQPVHLGESGVPNNQEEHGTHTGVEEEGDGDLSQKLHQLLTEMDEPSHDVVHDLLEDSDSHNLHYIDQPDATGTVVDSMGEGGAQREEL